MMNKTRHHAFTALGSILLLACGMSATAAHATKPTHAQVQVHYANPKSFTESRNYGYSDRYNDLNYLGPLKAYIIKHATPLLKSGQHLRITITDIALAGAYEPWLGPNWNHVRIMRNRYPPRIDLEFTWTGKNGTVLRQGTRKLRNPAYLTSGTPRLSENGPLRYDKALLGHWLRRGLSRL